MFRRKKKQITDEEIGIALSNMAEKIRSDMDFDFRVAFCYKNDHTPTENRRG